MKWMSIPLFVFWASSCAGATLKVLNLDEMTDESSAIVQCHITAQRYEWRDNARNSILTLYTVQAEHYLKGNLGATFEIFEPGGKMGILVQTVPGAPAFQVGEEMVLFVYTAKGRHQAIGFEQGAFRIGRDPVTGARILNHSQPFSSGGQIMSSDELASAAGQPRGRHTSRDLGEFLGQVSASVQRVSSQQSAAQKSAAAQAVRP